ncbi:MAG: 2-oxoacid:ferredoxin oxidoreductase subunit beta [Planctomycetes bacterium]|nr:2-oxoacid:ferredoxin oxidoreductase subunit beta [Planctomycetota bacterium]MBM4078960.1 2-oxoacid:ferredoxin oxidoreductase subunit beta [Planctomycetota bacterium]MBM4086560.1 2-oxoacid:ferredoxin oxidoreductase subunit beta [Planctomycetota bacterium]
MSDLFPYQTYLKLSRFPTPWCPGCGNGQVLKTVCQAFLELNLPKGQTTVVSGIGCSGRSAGFFDLDTVHTAHGRALPVAEGIKLANEKLNVIVLSGDGDLLGIGGNHLLHAARRNTALKVICLNNEIYGMTGGQKAPTTRLGVKTITSPEGNQERPVDAQALVKGHGGFYARSTTYHHGHLKKALLAALQHTGFAFVEVKTQCITNNGRRLGFKDAYEMLMYFKNTFKVNDGAPRLAENDIGVTT